MKKVLLIVASTLLASSSQAATGFLNNGLTEYDLTGCHNNNQDPRCKQIIKVACKSICTGHFNQEDDFGRACKDLCTLPVVQNQPTDDQSSQEPKSRLH